MFIKNNPCNNKRDGTVACMCVTNEGGLNIPYIYIYTRIYVSTYMQL